MLSESENFFLEKAIELAWSGMKKGEGGPFGAVVVREGVIIGEGNNRVTATNDPTAHAEVVAIREACRKLNHYQLTGCNIYTSCEPCPMCLGAIYWARPDRVIFANTREEAAAIEFDDDFIYREINTGMAQRRIPFLHVPHPEAQKLFTFWKNWDQKKMY